MNDVVDDGSWVPLRRRILALRSGLRKATRIELWLLGTPPLEMQEDGGGISDGETHSAITCDVGAGLLSRGTQCCICTTGTTSLWSKGNKRTVDDRVDRVESSDLVFCPGSVVD